MVIWTARHPAFVVEAFLKHGDFIITTQRLFRMEFNVRRYGAVPIPNSIKLMLIPYGSSRVGPDLIEQEQQ